MSRMITSSFFHAISRAMSCVAPMFAGLAVLSFGSLCFASVNVTVSQQSGQVLFGQTVTVTASASDTAHPNATFLYQFWIGPSGQLKMVRDYYSFTSFPWTPSNSEGTYEIQVNAIEVSGPISSQHPFPTTTGASGSGSAFYTVTARTTTSPVISPTKHPLVFLYSLPASMCPSGYTARVRFKLPNESAWHATYPPETCTGSKSVNFYIGGLRASTEYQIQHDVFHGPFDTPGPVMTATTGAANVSLPGYSVTKQFPPPNNTAYPVVLNGAYLNGSGRGFATDTSGHLIWYLAPTDVTMTYFDRPVDGGTFLVETNAPNSSHSVLLREYDMAGNLVRETNYWALSRQLTANGADPVTTEHHEALRLPDGSGRTAVIASVEHLCPSSACGSQGPGTVDVLGDQALVLDSNFQLVWWWNEFHHFPITRAAVLGETCGETSPGCPPPIINYPTYTVANDWTHSNSIWQSSDGNLILSSRHQDWIVKIPYENGAGPKDGAIIWTLGADGSLTGSPAFTVNSSDPHPWFSHQHDAELSNGVMTLFDNGNTRISEFGGHSRGQSWTLDQTNFVATLEVNIDVGQFSLATGSAQLLQNGNYTFDLGVINGASSTQEYTASGVLQSQENVTQISYRSFRMRSLYQEH